MTDHDFDELLQRLDPARHADVPSPDSVRGQAIRARAVGRPRQHRRLLVAVAAALMITGATAGAMVLWSGEPNIVAVTCYADADLDADRAPGTLELGLGVDACAPLWQGGPFGDGAALPPLVACLVDESVGVFPGPDGTCGDLGLPRSVGGESALATMSELNAALRAAIDQARCVAPADGVLDAQRIADDLGLDTGGWTVRQTSPTTADRPCASFSVDQQRKLIAIIPIPEAAG